MKARRFKTFPGWIIEDITFPRWQGKFGGRLPFITLRISYHGYIRKDKDDG